MVPLQRAWYQQAARGRNKDDKARLCKLESRGRKMIDRKEHEGLAEDKLVRKHTQACGAGAGGAGGPKYAPVVGGDTLMVLQPHQQQQQQQRQPFASMSTSSPTSMPSPTSRTSPAPTSMLAPASTLAPIRPTQDASHAQRPSRRILVGTN